MSSIAVTIMPRSGKDTLARLTVLSLLALSLLTPTFAQTTPVPTVPPAPTIPATEAIATGKIPLNAFTRETLKDFDAWDTDHNGILSEKEVDARLLDPQTTGEAAAAIGAIKIAMRSGKFILPPMTKEYFERYSADAYAHRRTRRPMGPTLPNPETAILPVGENSTPPAAKPTTSLANPAPTTAFPLYNSAYTSGLRRIERTPQAMFAPDTTLSLNAIHQGQIGDCYLLSVVGGMIDRDPASITHLVKANIDGSCDVTLPSGMTTHIGAVTDAEVAVSSGSVGTGRWLPALEEAYGRFRIRKKSGATTDAADEIGTDSATKGGSVRVTLQDLTGHKADGVSFRARGHAQEMPTVEQVTPKLPRVRREVADALRDHRLVAAGTGTALPLPPAINGRHAYAIIKFDEATDTLTIWNPHNNNFTPIGTPGLRSGYPTKGGVFNMPLVEFAQVYPSICWEKPETAAPAAAATPVSVAAGAAPSVTPIAKTPPAH